MFWRGVCPLAFVLALTTLIFTGACSQPEPQPEPTQQPSASGIAEMTVEAQQHVGLHVAPVRVTQLAQFLQVPGTVQPVDSRVIVLRPLARGRILEVRVRVGDRVRRGQTLAAFDNIEAGEVVAQLASARAELARLMAERRNLTRRAERAASLLRAGAIAEKEAEQARTDQEGAEHNVKAQEGVIAGLRSRIERFGLAPDSVSGPAITEILASFAGVVTAASTSPGQVVEPSSELFTVADLSTVWVQAEVYEKDIGRLRVGQPASIVVDAYPGRTFSGKVTYVSDFLDPRTRAARVRCEVPNPGMLLKLDMFANVSLPTSFHRNALAVPVSAIQQVEGRTVVFVRKDTTKFEARPVSRGETVREMIEITSGLTEGEPVVTEGSFHLKSILAGKDLGEE